MLFFIVEQRLRSPGERILNEKYDILIWKENDRAIASFKNWMKYEK